jgi:rubrerythrin
MTIEDPFLDSQRSREFHHEPRREPDRDLENMVLRMLETHGEREGTALASYERVAGESSAGGAVQYLVRLILEDERRHHRVFAEMANELKSFVWELDVEPRTPAMVDRPDPELLHETKGLLAFEKSDAKELRQLRKVLRHAPPSSLQPLLVDLMLHDTAKHISILEFIRDHLKRH